MDFGLNEVAKTRPAAIWAIFLTLEIRRGQNELDIGVVGDHTKGRKKVCEIYQLLKINYVLDLQIQRIMLAYAFLRASNLVNRSVPIATLSEYHIASFRPAECLISVVLCENSARWSRSASQEI
jgi:hypothetical protein